MRLKRMLALVPALVLALPTGALAAELTGQRKLESYAALHVPSGTYTLRLSGEEENRYAVFSASGERLSAAYDQIDVRQDMPYYIVTRDDQTHMNVRGLVDGSGQEVLPPVYGRVDVLSDRWIIGCVLADWSVIASADVYFDGEKIGTLSAEEYTMSTYAAAHGAYLGVSGGQAGFYLNSRFERVEGTADYFVTDEYFYDWRDQGVYHPATGQQAFVPSCTLTADEVERAVWYNDDGDFIDLQGRVIGSGPSVYKEYENVEYNGGSYLRLRANGKAGVADMRGEEVLPALYDALGGDTRSFFAAGYQVVMKDGQLSWIDMDGHVTASSPYAMNEGDYQGFSVNGLFVVARALGETVVITATAGELPQRYEDAMAAASPRQRILCVKQGGLWGAIDMDGNAVIPFEHTSQLQMSDDGSVAIGQRADGQFVYTVAFGDEPAATATATPTPTKTAALTPDPAAETEEDDGWVCPECGQVNTLNFCPLDGTARPEKSRRCQNCEYEFPEGVVVNFCPNCGVAVQ